jgi:hypothetical protein
MNIREKPDAAILNERFPGAYRLSSCKVIGAARKIESATQLDFSSVRAFDVLGPVLHPSGVS